MSMGTILNWRVTAKALNDKCRQSTPASSRQLEICRLKSGIAGISATPSQGSLAMWKRSEQHETMQALTLIQYGRTPEVPQRANPRPLFRPTADR